MYGKGGAFTLSLNILFFNAESQLILMIHFITAGKFWSIIKFQTDGQTRGGGLRSAYSPSTFLKQQEDYKE